MWIKIVHGACGTLLRKEQHQKHLYCAKSIQSNWGMGRGKYLWIHYNEKWFWGLVLKKMQNQLMV